MKLLGERPKSRYTHVPNELIRDQDVSSDARLLAIYLLSVSNGWETNQEQIAAALGWPTKSKRVGAAIKNLTETGWLRHNELKGPKGNIYGHEYVMHRGRRFHSTTVKSTVMDEPTTVKSTPVTTVESTVLIKEQKDQETAAAEWPQPVDEQVWGTGPDGSMVEGYLTSSGEFVPFVVSSPDPTPAVGGRVSDDLNDFIPTC